MQWIYLWIIFFKAASHRTPIMSELRLLKPLKTGKMSVPFQWQSRNCSFFYAYCVWSCIQCCILFPFHNKPNHIPNCNDVQASFWQHHFSLTLPSNWQRMTLWFWPQVLLLWLWILFVETPASCPWHPHYLTMLATMLQFEAFPSSSMCS